MTHAPRHMAQRSKRVSLVGDLSMRKAVSAGMTVAIPSVGAVVAAAPSTAATDSSATPLPTSAAATTAPHATVMYGSRGPDVQAVQSAVGVTVDGIFGPLTMAAVKAYQKAHGLVADGIVGPLTWAAVNGAAAAPTPAAVTTPVAKPATTTPAVSTSTQTQSADAQNPATTTATPVVAPNPATAAAPKTILVGSTDVAVKVLQSKLGIAVTGVFASDVQTSVKAFQKAHGLVADGIVGPLTWGQIGVSASDVAVLAPTLTVTPAAKPAVTTPVVTTPAVATTVKPAVATPAAKPAVTTPAAVTPAVKPTTTPAVATPAVATPTAKPAVTTPAVKPATTTPAAIAPAVKPATTTPAAIAPAVKPVATPAVTTPAAVTPAVTTPTVKPVTPPATTAPVVTVSTTTTSTPQVASASAQQIIAFAETFIGTPYFYGGNGPASFDCSGFTSYVFSHFGYTMPRTAEQQHAYFTPTTNPQPGDLLFYGTNPAYHVAIYLGNGMMIDDNHPGGSVGIRAIYGTPSGYARVINH